jgi:predicted O-methyltransferase YrrM
MSLKKKITFFLQQLIKPNSIDKERVDLYKIKKVNFDLQNLRRANEINLDQIFNSHEINEFWKNTSVAIEKLGIPDGTGGVNPGDQRAIFYLISALKPKSVLEIGTHIGGSTVIIASAFSNFKTEKNSKLVSVDIRDVNSAKKKPWLKYGTKHSPKEMIDLLGYSSNVQFVKNTSLDYAKKSKQKFDFIFLDGDHTAKTVYEEIPIALRLLNPNGVILLHDFFTNCEPLWSNGSVIPGPFMAVERIIKEERNVQVKALGELPWPTKLGSNVTSLALFLRQTDEFNF